MPKFPFEASPDEIARDPEQFVDAVFACLGSEFMVMPKGPGFVDYPVFERGYEALKAATAAFSQLTPDRVLEVAQAEPISLIVLRTMLGFTPPEWAYVATQRTGTAVSQGFLRSLDRKIRMAPEASLRPTKTTRERIEALLKTACDLLVSGVPDTEDGKVHSIWGHYLGTAYRFLSTCDGCRDWRHP